MVGFGLVSCSEKTTEESVTVENVEMHDDHHGEIDLTEGLVLDNGNKWLINDEMRPHLVDAENALKTFIEEGSDEYNQLGVELEKHNADLITSCTMEGKGHDELHKWLHHHIELIEDLKNASNDEEGQNAVNSLVDSFQEFHEYFN